MNITGHKTTEMFLRYNTVDDLDAREAMERLSGFLEGKEERETGKSDTKVTHLRDRISSVKREGFADGQTP